MNRVQAAGLVLVGVAFGCGAAVVAPVVVSHAQPHAGSWDCFVVDRLPDLNAARSWKGAAGITAGLNEAAPGVVAGTMISVMPGGPTSSVVCVKD
jgi:hypothetical protein